MDKKYLYPITAIICAVILGGSFLLVQVNKQQSIEKQKQMEIDHENKIIKEKKEAEEATQRLLNWCLDDADTAYWNYVELNMEERDDGTYWGATWKWDEAEARKKAVEDKCFKQYK
jgi:hypothetical protein